MPKLNILSVVFLSILSASLFAKDYRILESQDTKVFSESTHSQLVKQALELKAEIDQKNREDLQRVFVKIQSKYSPENSAELLKQAAALIEQDKARFLAIQKIIPTVKVDPFKYAPFKSSIGKLVGNETNPGIFDDALKVLAHQNAEKLSFVPYVTTTPAEQNALKVAFLYLYKAYSKAPLALQELHMVYPAEVPPTVQIADENMSDWIKGNVLQAINVGYVYGGDIQNKICRGVDCSSFVSYVTTPNVKVTEGPLSAKMSTMVMEYTARELGAGAKIESDAEIKLRDDFLLNWQMDRALREYSALIPQDMKDVKEGDIIVWRWVPPGKTAKTGHAVMVIKILSEKTFISLEANREDDKSLEGIVLTERSLLKEGADTYVLRRK